MGGFPNQVSYLTWCERHQKKAFTRRNAKKVIRVLPGHEGMRRYPCNYISNGWHVGHLPPAVLEGRLSAREVYGSRAA